MQHPTSGKVHSIWAAIFISAIGPQSIATLVIGYNYHLVAITNANVSLITILFYLTVSCKSTSFDTRAYAYMK